MSNPWYYLEDYLLTYLLPWCPLQNIVTHRIKLIHTCTCIRAHFGQSGVRENLHIQNIYRRRMSKSRPFSFNNMRNHHICNIKMVPKVLSLFSKYVKIFRIIIQLYVYVSIIWFFGVCLFHNMHICLDPGQSIIITTSTFTLYCPASRTTLVATRFRVAVICPIIQVPHCIRVFFYFVWFVFINHIFQFYYELCTFCNILDIYLS